MDDPYDRASLHRDANHVGYVLHVAISEGLRPIDGVDPDRHIFRLQLFSVGSSHQLERWNSCAVTLHDLLQLSLVLVAALRARHR